MLSGALGGPAWVPGDSPHAFAFLHRFLFTLGSVSTCDTAYETILRNVRRTKVQSVGECFHEPANLVSDSAVMFKRFLLIGRTFR